jgi:hypothetical protein
MFAVVLAVALVSTPVVAGQRGNGGGPKPKPVTASQPKTQTSHPQPPKTQTTKTQPAKTHSPKSHGTTAHAAKTSKGSGTSTVKEHGSAAAKKSDRAATTSSSVTTTTDTPATLTPVQQKLQRNTNLADKLRDRLPAGTDLMLAAKDFRNLGQFVAAVNVSNNLEIPFANLKARMVDDGLSLGQAIQKERPSADATAEVRRAETTATTMIGESEATQTKTKQPKAKASKPTTGSGHKTR